MILIAFLLILLITVIEASIMYILGWLLGMDTILGILFSYKLLFLIFFGLNIWELICDLFIRSKNGGSE